MSVHGRQKETLPLGSRTEPLPAKPQMGVVGFRSPAWGRSAHRPPGSRRRGDKEGSGRQRCRPQGGCRDGRSGDSSQSPSSKPLGPHGGSFLTCRDVGPFYSFPLLC